MSLPPFCPESNPEATAEHVMLLSVGGAGGATWGTAAQATAAIMQATKILKTLKDILISGCGLLPEVALVF